VNGRFASGKGGGEGLRYSFGRGKGSEIVGASSPWDKTANYGTSGTGFEVTDKRNGKKTMYQITGTGAIVGLGQNIATDNVYHKAVSQGKMTSKELVEKVVSNGGRFLPSSKVKEITEAYKIERANTPDYELGGRVPWGNKDNRQAARIQHITDRVQRRPRGYYAGS